jgi:hypothetical protein
MRAVRRRRGGCHASPLLGGIATAVGKGTQGVLKALPIVSLSSRRTSALLGDIATAVGSPLKPS